MSRRVGVVVNPERPELGDEIVHLLRGHGCVVTVAEPDAPDDLAAAIDSLVAGGIEILAAVGGDGTQRTAAARLLGTDVALAVVPGGTVNLLAQVIGTADIESTARAAAAGRRREIDVGRIDGEAFVLNASTGWDAAVIERVDDGAKRFGRLGYTVTGIREWRRSEPRRVTIELEGASWYDEPALTVVVLNVGQRASESLYVAPDARLDDGRLDVVVLRRHSIVGLVKSAWAVLRGTEAPRQDVVRAQAAEIVIEWDREMAVQCDGDERGQARRTSYKVDPVPLHVVVPDS